jgi:MGT family glycosyltransferase
MFVMKFLFCSLASYGYINPMIGIAQVLCQRGHTVAFATGSNFSNFLDQLGFKRIPRTHNDGLSFQPEIWADPISIAIQIKHIEYAIEYFSPDILVGNQLTFGSLIAGEMFNLPVGTLGFNTYLLPTSEDCFQSLSISATEERLHWRYKDMMKHYNNALQLLGLPPSSKNLHETPLLGDLFLVQSIPELEINVSQLPNKVHLVGSCLWDLPLKNEPLLDLLNSAQACGMDIIYVQPGRSFKDPKFWPLLVEVLANQPLRVIASVGRMDGDPGQYPSNFFVSDHIPQSLVLPYTSAVISNGHTTSVLGALTHGIPSLLIPNGSGTEEIAESCERAGAVVCLPLCEVTTETLSTSIKFILENVSLKQNALRLQSEFEKYDGLEIAASLFEQLATTQHPVLRRTKELV